jgi:hypothetical protein
MKKVISVLLIVLGSLSVSGALSSTIKITRVLVVTGGHSYNKVTFNEMLSSLGSNLTFEVQY